ncbi:MAG TPA: methyltransferase domain-containing protein, partial [Polyangiaceae bacterium]|nr:methyltransferase domain-containing protein [Polyangiaceae bacterium]
MHAQRPSTEINPALMALAGRPRTVLDVGCGAGVGSLFARRAGARVTGIERSAPLSAQARVLLDEVHGIDPANLHAVEIALGERRFDLITMPDILERTDDPAGLVRNYVRYLEPGGRLIVSARNPKAWPVRAGVAGPQIGYSTVEGCAPRLLTRRELTDFVTAAGLELLEVERNPILLKALRGVLSDSAFMSLKHGEETPTGFRDWSPYQMYLSLVRPFESLLAGGLGELAVYQNVVVARSKPKTGPLSLSVGMLTMDEEESIAKMIEEIRRYAPDAELLIVDSSLKDRTPVIAEQMGARVLRQLPPRGHGPAMELLMYEAARQSDALIYLDCDFTYPPSMPPKI